MVSLLSAGQALNPRHTMPDSVHHTCAGANYCSDRCDWQNTDFWSTMHVFLGTCFWEAVWPSDKEEEGERTNVKVQAFLAAG